MTQRMASRRRRSHGVVVTGVSLTPRALALLKEMGEDAGESRSALVRRLIREGYQKHLARKARESVLLSQQP